MTYLKCAAVTVQKAVRRLAARRVLQQLLHETQAAAETKEEEAAKKASGISKLVLRDKGLRDLAKFARRSAKKARRLVAKAEKSPADKVCSSRFVWACVMVVRRARSVLLAVLTLAAGLAAASTAPPLGASWRQQRLVFGSDEYKAAVPQKALLCHVLLTHASYVVSIGFVQTTVYSCFPLMKEAGVLSQQQISRMLTAGTACFVVGKLTTAQILDLVGPKAAFITNMIIGGLLCLTFASGLSGLAAEICWCVYKLFSATSWPSVVQMLAYWASRRDVAKAFSLYSTASRTGAIAASLGVGVLMRRSEHGWKLALLGTGLATLLVFLLCKGVVDETPARVLAQHNVAATSPLERDPSYRPLLRALRLQWQRRPKLPERLQRLQRESHRALWRSKSAGPDDVVHLKPAALLRMFAGRPNFWLAIGAAMGYSPIRQFEGALACQPQFPLRPWPDLSTHAPQRDAPLPESESYPAIAARDARICDPPPARAWRSPHPTLLARVARTRTWHRAWRGDCRHRIPRGVLGVGACGQPALL
eukprot:Transcript_32484.p1 GENE.Transcript_32484~~Transcript_32484.p1  ORF type:complete len:534 (-),score=81.32 Transcript_32484:1101-2702(-)